MQSHNSIQVGEYVYFQPKIGKGSFSKVYYGNHLTSKDAVAIKKINKKSIQKLSFDRIMKEINLLKELDHSNIVKYRDMLSDDNNIYIVNEYCNGGTMKTFLNEHEDIKEVGVRFCFTQVKDALKYLVDRNIYHRDIKPQNILIHYKRQNVLNFDIDYKNVQLKIADFGFAKEISNDNMTDTLCGTPLYMAPEIVYDKKYSINSDLWSVGVVLFEMVYGYFPFEKPKNIVELMKSINSIKLTFPKVSDNLSNLLSRLLQKSPKKRISWSEFFNHPWFSEENRIHEEGVYEELYGVEINDEKLDSSICKTLKNTIKINHQKDKNIQHDTTIKITGKMNIINDYCDRISYSAPTPSIPISIPTKKKDTLSDNVYKYVTYSVDSIRKFISK